MNPTQRYEIWQKLTNNQLAAVELAADLQDAKKRIQQLAQMFPGDYLILDRETSSLIVLAEE